MARAEDEEAARDAQAFRPSSRPFIIAIAANFLLAAACLGVPYWRGQMHAKESLAAFARFAACLYGGDARGSLGLGLPASTDAQFASQFMRAGAGWPERCRADLDASVPPEVIFVWPSVKQAGAEVRAVAPLVRTELDDITRLRTRGGSRRVPTRTLAAVSRLRAGLTLLARAADADETLDDDAIVFAHAPSLAEPAKLPLYAGASATLSVRAAEDGLEAIALDGGGISWLRVAHGQIERRRLARSSLVRATIREGDHSYLVWAMPPNRCAEREDRCVKRALGIAAWDRRAEKLPTPTWLRAHPAGRADRALHVRGAGELDVLALASATGDVEVRRFALTAPDAQAASAPAAQEDEKTPPRGALALWPLPAPPADAVLLLDAVLYTVVAEGASNAFLWAYASIATPPPLQPVSTLSGAHPWLATCEASTTRWLVHGTDASLAVTRHDATGVLTPLPPVALAVAPPWHAEDPERDRVRLLCTDGALTLLALAAGQALVQVRCDASHCDAPRNLARDVAGFAAVEAAGGLVVATTGAAHPEIAVQRLSARGEVTEPPTTPSVCWDPLGGMCGQPTLVATGGRLLLAARDGADLLALESADAGKTWRAMSGLKTSGPAGDADAVLRQHRARHQGAK